MSYIADIQRNPVTQSTEPHDVNPWLLGMPSGSSYIHIQWNALHQHSAGESWLLHVILHPAETNGGPPTMVMTIILHNIQY